MLLIDIGNTRLKWCRTGQLLKQPAQALIHNNDFFAAFSEIRQRELNITRVAIASVQKAEVREHILLACQQVFGLTPFMPVSTRQCGNLVNVYPEPARLGVDRWLAMLGAFELAKSAVCVVDCGSAATFDFVSASGEHRGGYIVPGAQIMLTSLLGNTQNIRPTEKTSFDAHFLPGKNTGEAVMHGISFLLHAAIETAFREISSKLDENPRLFLTGGDSEWLAPALSVPHEHCADLVLYGLHIAAEISEAST